MKNRATARFRFIKNTDVDVSSPGGEDLYLR